MAARWFPEGCVASPHHLASAAGHAVLASGGNAVDAAVAANLVLAVVTPYHCGVGGDLLAIVWDGVANGLMSIGSAPAGATPEAVRSAIAGHRPDPSPPAARAGGGSGHRPDPSPPAARAGGGSGHRPDHTFEPARSDGGSRTDTTPSLPGTAGMPIFGALSVTVPGAAAGWARLLERWGSRSFGELASGAVRLAREGFPVSPQGAEHVDRGRRLVGDQPGWDATYGRMRAGERFVQADLAGTLEALAADGPDALYRGPIGERLVATLSEHGSTMTLDDLAAHEVAEVAPLRGSYREVEVLELPPPTQGVTALTALGILDAWGALPADPAAATHLRIEAVRAALADRQEHLADPAAMQVTADDLLSPDRLAAIADHLDVEVAASWPPARPAPGGTAYLCAADRDGMLVSLIQSNFVGFGSGVVVEGTGIGLHNRGAHFSLDPADPNAIGPRKRPMHTLVPAMALRAGTPWLVFGTMGGDGQTQTHVQLLGNLVDLGMDVQDAIDAARWVIDVSDGSIAIEPGAAAPIIAGLARRGHTVRAMAADDHLAGHAHAIEMTAAGYAAGSDPRCEGAVIGC